MPAGLAVCGHKNSHQTNSIIGTKTNRIEGSGGDRRMHVPGDFVPDLMMSGFVIDATGRFDPARIPYQGPTSLIFGCKYTVPVKEYRG